MEILIEEKRDNPLLSRMEVEFTVRHPKEKSPARAAVKDAVAKTIGANKELVVIDHMNTTFGKGESKGYAKVYRKKEDALNIEREHILKRNHLIQKKKEGEEEEKKE